jgi:hypothetical protein
MNSLSTQEHYVTLVLRNGSTKKIEFAGFLLSLWLSSKVLGWRAGKTRIERFFSFAKK